MTKTDIIEVSACSGLLSKKFVCKVRRRGLRDTVGKLSGGDSHTFPEAFDEKKNDEDGIRTHACRAHWISSPTP